MFRNVCVCVYTYIFQITINGEKRLLNGKIARSDIWESLEDGNGRKKLYNYVII